FPFLEKFDFAVDLRDDRRILGLASLEELGDTRETAGDVLGAQAFARHPRDDGTRRDLLAFLGVDAGPFRQGIEIERFALGVLDQDLRVEFATVFENRPADVAGGFPFRADRLTFDAVLEADRTADLGEN